MKTDSAPPQATLWEPLGVTAFRLLWIATVISNVGMAIQGVAATWLMMSVDARPTMVAALQAAATLGTCKQCLVGLSGGTIVRRGLDSQPHTCSTSVFRTLWRGG
ncbi:MFS transporter [Paucibacter sp. M5-1]|uniref:MFS transporter n=1 Tax=Paucibacter sp. M5-1 TaxID=3015998 RepID=UPI003F7D6354